MFTRDRSYTIINKDENTKQFYVYILKLSNGKFYAGHTNKLQSRLSEHTDGKEPYTKGLNPKVQYFEILPTRQSAKQREAFLINLIHNNDREIRNMIFEFKDIVSYLNFQ